LTLFDVLDANVRDFMIRERVCCAFLEFEIEDVGDIVRLRITAPRRASIAAETIFTSSCAGAKDHRVRAVGPLFVCAWQGLSQRSRRRS
jgi:hypothetical protein